MRWPCWPRVAPAAACWKSEQVFSDKVFSGKHIKPKDYPIHGIDVSKFQGDIDWNAVANSGDRVRQLIKSGSSNIRIVTESGHACSPAELEGLAEFENESDDS